LKLLLFAYVIVSFVAGYGAYINAGGFVSFSLISTSMLAWWAGSGLRGSLIAGKSTEKIAGFVMAAIFLGIGHWLAASSGFRVVLWENSIGGGIWNLIGAFIGFIATTKADTEPKEESEQHS
jgi:hypothetical protein